MTEEKRYYGIGGWLILILLGLVISPIGNALYIFIDLVSFFEPDIWYNITTSGTELYHPLFAVFIIFELIMNILLVIAPIGLLILMFKKSRLFPKAMIIFLYSGLLMQLVDVSIAVPIFNGVPFYAEVKNELISATIKDTVRILIYTVIWIRYFKVSKRVKNTFLSDREETVNNQDVQMNS